MKNSKKGISLIVLIITIIVIVILATAILVSVLTNNPISEANKARYESDRDNMQAVFTNTVGKIMAENQGVVNVTAGQINTETSGVNETTGEVAYTVDNAMVAANASGKIIFDKGINDATTYYTGKKLPIYAAGETKWYVDNEGVLSLEVAGVKYGSGSVEETLEAGLYKVDGTFISWSDLTDTNYKSLTYFVMSNQRTSGILYIDENKQLSSAFDFHSGDNLSNDFLDGTLVISSDVIGIDYNAFYNCTNLTKIILPDSVTNIDDYAFGNCDNLTNIEIPDSVTNISEYAFDDCDNLSYIVINENNPVYDSRNNCNAIIETATNTLIKGCKNTTIPNDITTIGKYSFSGIKNLVSLNIPNNITNIETYAFSNCIDLTEIKLPENLTTLNPCVFSGCKSLMTITLPHNITTIPEKAFYNCYFTSFTIPNNITEIEKEAFDNCDNLTNIEIPDSVTNIGEYAFDHCDNLKYIKIGNGVKTIEKSAFNYCVNLETIDLGNNVTNIGNSIFWMCKNLTSIKIPNSTTSIGNNIFGYCEKLTSIIVDENNPVYDSRNNCNAIIETATNTLISGCSTSTISNTIKNIGPSAFQGCKNLISITIPNGLINIGQGAFYECRNLISIEIPDSVTNIGINAFSYCTGLTTIYIPSSVIVISAPSNYTKSPFNGCSESLKLYCGASKKQSGWESYWDYYGYGKRLSVTYNITRGVYESTYKQ